MKTRTVLLAAASLMLPGVFATSAGAVTYTVTKTADTADGTCNNDCSLREAITAANGDTAADTVVLPAGTLVTSIPGAAEDANANGDLDLTNDITIRGTGAGSTTVLDQTAGRAFQVRGSGTDATIEDLTITGADTSDTGAAVSLTDQGTLTLDRVVVRGNRTTTFGAVHASTGTLNISQSAIVQNTAGGGGGLYLSSNFAAGTVINTTIAGNVAIAGPGGGIWAQFPYTQLELVYSTITGNFAATSGGGIGPNGLSIRSSILTGNGTVPGTYVNCGSGTLPTSYGGNVGDPACGITGPTDVAATDAKLAALGGTIPAMVPLAGSPAIDRGTGTCPATDAHGVARPQGGACDAGAAEYAPPAPPATVTVTETVTTPGPTVTITTPAITPPSARSLPSIRGTARKGRTLTCSRGRWASASKYKYAWLRDSKPIRKQSKSRYKLTKSDRRHVIACRVTASGKGGRTTALSVGRYLR